MIHSIDAFWLLTDPFEERPDVRFLIPTHPVRAALGQLRDRLSRQPGWIVLAGQPGVGKSVLVQLFVESMEEPAPVAVIHDSEGDAPGLLVQIAERLGRPVASLSSDARGHGPHDGQRPLIILDAAECLTEATVAELERTFATRGTGSGPRPLLVDFIAVVESTPASPSPGWAVAREAAVVTLQPLSMEDTAEYVRRRVRIAAGGERDLFDAGALDAIFRHTGGLPDIINRVCALALDRVARAGGSGITARDIEDAAGVLGELPGAVRDALEGIDEPVPPSPSERATSVSPSPAEPTAIDAASFPSQAEPPLTPPPTEPLHSRGEPRSSPAPGPVPIARPAPTPSYRGTSPLVVMLAALVGSVIGGAIVLLATGQLGPRQSPGTAVVLPDVAAAPPTQVPVADPPGTDRAEPELLLLETPTGELIADLPVRAERDVPTRPETAGAGVGAESMEWTATPPPTPPGPASIPEPETAAQAALPAVGAAAPQEFPPTPAGPESPARVGLPLVEAAPILEHALIAHAPAGTAWSVRLLELQTGSPRTIEHAEIALGEFGGRLQMLAVLAGDGARRPARMIGTDLEASEGETRVFWPEERVIRPAIADDPFAGTGFRYQDFQPQRAAQFEISALEGDLLDGEPVFVVTATRLGDASAQERIEIVIGERDERLLELRSFAADTGELIRRVELPRPPAVESPGEARIEEWRVYGPTGAEIARAQVEIGQLAADTQADLFTFSRLSNPDFTIPRR